MFEKDGIAIVEKFLPSETLEKLNDELDIVFSKYSINGSLSATRLMRWTETREHVECTVPGLLLSVNIFEIIIDVAEEFKKIFDRFSTEDYVLTAAHVFSEKGNRVPMFWHTDNRDGMMRAIVYLQGGEDRSGKFMFMKGTHDRDYYVDHKLSEEKILELQDKVFDCSAPVGSLILFDSRGFHAKKTCWDERRIMFLEFYPRNNQHGKERVLLSSNHLTPKVISNINLFANVEFDSKNLGISGFERNLASPQALPLGIILAELKKSVVHTTLNLLKCAFDAILRLFAK